MFLADGGIVITTAQPLDAAALKAGARRALITCDTAFKFRFGGQNPAAGTWHHCSANAQLSVQEDLAGFRMIATSGTPTAYVTYFDKVEQRGNGE